MTINRETKNGEDEASQPKGEKVVIKGGWIHSTTDMSSDGMAKAEKAEPVSDVHDRGMRCGGRGWRTHGRRKGDVKERR